MTEASGLPPDDFAWAQAKLLYEETKEPVKQIAASLGMSGIALSLKAMKLGWKMRGLSKPQRKKREAKAVTTADALKRMKELLQERITHLESEIKELGEDVSQLGNERGLRSMNLLVRTLDKVLDLERKDKLKRKRDAHNFKHFDEQQRAALAAKIERLETQWTGEALVEDGDRSGSTGAEPPVALLGEAGPATAA
jgi:uncharacterized protein (UPF0335 family)